jgi:photosystem II stability/assembly factor-like uncharacterized protein
MNRSLFLLTCMVAFSVSLLAQTLDMEKLKGMKPRNIGPGGMSGRITAIDAVVSDPSIIYAGAASGGVWKSTSGGINWEPIFDKEAVQSVGAIAIQQDNPSVVWVGTGEGNPRNSLNGGYGIYKSLDAGKTWKLMGLEKTRHIYRIVIDPKNPNTVYVAAIGSPWGEHPERGVYKTTDGGETWNRILFVNEKTGCADLVMDPSNPNKLIASMWEHRRWPWTFKSGGPGSGVYITYDGGKNWKKITEKEGFPEGELGRAGLAISSSKPDIIYVYLESKKNGLYRSTDGGAKWQLVNDKMNEIGDRPFYYSEIHVDPKNENRVYAIFSRVNVSEDGGKSFRELLPYSGVHPDHHAWWINPENPSMIIDGNDGGLNITRDMGKNWQFVENIAVGQFYHINVDNDQPYNVYGGLQDNGSWVGPSYVWKEDGIRNSYWQPVMFGDGFDVQPDPDNNRYGYAMSQQGYLGRYDRVTGYQKFIRPTHPDPKVELRFNWNSALALDPFDHNTIYYGSQFVHVSRDKGNTWDVLSPDLSTNNPEKQKQHESGGLTMDATGAENHCTILAIEPSPVEKGVLWAGTDDGNVQISRDAGKTWTNVSAKIGGMPKNAWVPQIRASVHNGGEAIVTVNNYRQFDYKPYLFRTRNYGQTWESLVTPAQFGESNYILSAIQDVVEPKLLFVGAENGLWVSLDDGKNWTRWTSGFPAGVPVMDLAIQAREHDLVIGTFGRGIYVLDDIRPLRELVKEGAQSLNKTINVFAPPDAYSAVIQDPAGILFPGNGMFIGTNKTFGAQITYVINKPAEAKKEEKPSGKDEKKKKADTKTAKKRPDESQVKPTAKDSLSTVPKDTTQNKKSTIKYDSLTLEVFDSQGMKIRTLKQKAPDDNGINRMRWALNEKGERYPSRTKPSADAPEPGGVGVLPGTYKLRLTFGGQKDSVTINVKSDPRYNVAASVFQDRYKLLKDLEKLTRLAAEATTRLRESKEIADDYEKKMNEVKRDEYKGALDKTKVVKDSISALFDYILGKEDKRQGIVRQKEPTPVSYIGEAQNYIGGSLDPVSATDQRVYQFAQDKIKEVIDRVNRFYEKTWPEYRSTVEKVVISPFKEYQPLKKD